MYSGASWYAVHTHAKQEDRADSNLRAWGVEIFAPKIKAPRRCPYTNRLRYFVKPMFSRYIFARFEPIISLHKILFTRGVHSIVSYGNVPSAIDDQIIFTLKSRLDADGLVHLGDSFQTGDPVLITDGPLRGFTGVFDRATKDAERVMILLKTVCYQPVVSVEMGVVMKL